MNKHCKQNQAARIYLNTFCKILNDMICGMTNAPLTDSISHNFIVQMIPHHEAAIRMSQNVLKYTTDTTLCNIATDIITEQTKSIENMLAIKQCCSNVTNTRQDLCRYQSKMDRIMRNMFSKMNNACATNRIDCDFIWEMIPHHEGAVEMSETTLRAGICPELKPILEAIISSQTKGIAQMQHLQYSLNC